MFDEGVELAQEFSLCPILNFGATCFVVDGAGAVLRKKECHPSPFRGFDASVRSYDAVERILLDLKFLVHSDKRRKTQCLGLGNESVDDPLWTDSSAHNL